MSNPVAHRNEPMVVIPSWLKFNEHPVYGWVSLEQPEMKAAAYNRGRINDILGNLK